LTANLKPHPPIRLGVNVDHVATLRQQRGTAYPDPVEAARLAESAGADQITVHLREDRRHIVDRDVYRLRKSVKTALNLEMAATEEMLKIALDLAPDTVTLVPERREEKTTEGGLDVVGNPFLKQYIASLTQTGIAVSLFIDPSAEQIQATSLAGAAIIEFHTGDYCEATAAMLKTIESAPQAAILSGAMLELTRLKEASITAETLGLSVVAGHGLDYENVKAVTAIKQIEELNIGHSIVSRSVFVGFERAVQEMIAAIKR
jgi:pyridoxine 5-phosphate synthase